MEIGGVFPESFLNKIDTSLLGWTPADNFIKFKLGNIKREIIDAATFGKKEYSFYAPKGINFEPYLPGCSITLLQNAVSSYCRPDPDEFVCYVVSWKA